CLPTSCNGFYAGANLIGTMTNVDVIGQGIGGSFAGGGQSIGAQLGYQFTDGKFFIGAEAFGAWTINGSPTAVGGVAPTWLFGQVLKIGGSLSAILGPAPQGPSIPATIASQLISPYILFGAVERNWGTGWSTGAGAEFALAQNWFADVRYMYVD